VAKALEVSEQTFHRWRAQYGGMKADEAKRLRLERENASLKRIVADKELENVALKEVANGTDESQVRTCGCTPAGIFSFLAPCGHPATRLRYSSSAARARARSIASRCSRLRRLLRPPLWRRWDPVRSSTLRSFFFVGSSSACR